MSLSNERNSSSIREIIFFSLSCFGTLQTFSRAFDQLILKLRLSHISFIISVMTEFLPVFVGRHREEMSTGGSILTAEAIQIVKVNEEAHTFRLSDEDLTRIILQENVKNRDVVIVSVAGAFRKGKSFLLDFFLRYLYAKVRNN